MASLKDLKVRIGSVKNTQKITKAMKMVAAAKLRRAKDQAEAARPYAESIEKMLQSVVSRMDAMDASPILLRGTGHDHTHLVVVATADRGLCGGFNASIVKEARQLITRLQREGKKVCVLCVGKKGAEQLQLQFGSLIIERIEGLYRSNPSYEDAKHVAQRVQAVIDAHHIDVCHMIYSVFLSAIAQKVHVQQLMPLLLVHDPLSDVLVPEASMVEFEPSQQEILEDLVPKNFTVQIFRALLENTASEQGARMTAMDNATRNAGDMIARLTLQYNRTRQAAITKELIEIISGAEAV
ncbi:MAG: F0F1 ATP synthase subunit gamma [Alphaproteobacteria bacterium]|nr:MAG: F0F1 ATP synthase subunit gamma [Alphaproteobacteria bacterium]TAF14609.1 MAG: F0F1 ATP synthase subunit gamma [Alphaproteobacteria bacterium]TAF41696.1 MAG: F0F1 ATP synthase subunit gamma [Alphaproteobacteria bacterium]TAF75637.1 MAG: F0F1 ATP synthase subunit gamma [Alphaproteobacteria bacterium]